LNTRGVTTIALSVIQERTASKIFGGAMPESVAYVGNEALR
jgi:hypothetical protein